jgi:choline-sulfatase
MRFVLTQPGTRMKAMTQPPRPNILLIMADQLSAQYLPSYGHKVVKAPHLSKLAAGGMQFNSAYTNSPLCAPSRFVMMTGLRNTNIGAYDNASELPASIPTFAHYLRAGGYQTSLSGKMHFVGPDQLHGFEERLTTDIYPADFGWTPNWDDPDGRFDWWYHNMDSVRFAGTAEATNQLDYDDEVGFQAVRKLRDLARTADKRPWMLTASFTHPHDPYVMRQEYWDRYDHDEVDLPHVGALPLDGLDPHSRRLRNVSDMDTAPLTEAMVRNARHAYYSSISYVDDWVGNLLDTLDKSGMADNTLVIFTADHGDMLGERGLWYKMNFFEGACRIPLLVAGPGVSSGSSQDHVSLVDVLPTLAEVAGLQNWESIRTDGSSFVSLLGGTAAPHRQVLGEYLGEGAIAPILMIRSGKWKYVHCDVDPAQLYDLTADPHELVNLAADDSYAHVVAEFSAQIAATWDTKQINEDVLASQRSRRLIDTAMRQGQRTSWDFQPHVDARERYMRNHFDLNDVERSRRLPPTPQAD